MSGGHEPTAGAGVEVRASGPLAALVECGDRDPGVVVTRLAERGVAPGSGAVVEVVPGATTVLIECRTTDAVAAAVRVAVAELTRPARGTTTPDAARGPVEIPVAFDGADLATVADRCELDPTDVVTRVTAAAYRVAFCGFAPGFAYLRGLDPALHLPRRDDPRTRVPAGSFAIAGEFAAVYPGVSPGGWHLLGHTDLAVWSVERDPPALLTPGTDVRVVAVR